MSHRELFLHPYYFSASLPNGIKSKIKLYADDVLLYNTIHSQEDCHNLQQDLNLLEEWATKWKMSFNLQKCEFLRITNKEYPIFSQYLIQNEIIREVTYAKYLGVTINQNLKWSEHVKQITIVFMDFCDATCIAALYQLKLTVIKLL